MIRFFVAIVFIFLFFLSCQQETSEKSTAKSYEKFCANCHLSPDPTKIPKHIWEETVLPEMAARLGYKYNNYNPYSKQSMEENMYIDVAKIYPTSPLIDSATWNSIHDYVLKMAPDSIPLDLTRKDRNHSLDLFDTIKISDSRTQTAATNFIKFDTSRSQFQVGNAYGQMTYWPSKGSEKLQHPSSVIGINNYEGKIYKTEIGYMNPSQKPKGILYESINGKRDSIANKLHRPVFVHTEDLNEDGKIEHIVCEFGHHTGELSLHTETDEGYQEKILLPLPGAIKVAVHDMDGDGRKDIVALVSQGQEGIYIFYQSEDLKFRMTHPVQLSSEHGTSWFELLDYDGDGDQDIVIANGDNADYSTFNKPYHGIRLYINDGNNRYEEAFFYPIYGATRVIAEDFDSDGKIDFAVMSYFAEMEKLGKESFVLLRGKDPANYEFEAQTFDEALPGRWLVMEAGDYDGDGDMDLALGSFLMPIDKQFKISQKLFAFENIQFLILKNKTF